MARDHSNSEFNLRPQITPPTSNSKHPSPDALLSPQQNNGRVAISVNSICFKSYSSLNPATRTFFIFTLAAIGMAILVALLPAEGHDQLWCLYVAKRILDGTKLYGPELLESNPPLIMGMLTIPAALSNLTHLPVTLLFKAAVLLTEFGIAVLSLNLLRRLSPKLSAAALWSLAFAFIVIFTVLPARDFGQRDHLLGLLCLPYVLCAALLLRSAGEVQAEAVQSPTSLMRIAVGVLAGLGISLKPHHALIPIAIEVALLIKRRSLVTSLRPERFALLATAAAFIITIRVVTPAYLNNIVPLLRDVYWAIGHLTLPQLLAESLQLHLLGLVTVGIYLVQQKQQTLPAFLILAGTASTVAYYLQGTGWYYQQLPALSFFALAFWLLLIETADHLRLSPPIWMPKAALALTLLALGLTAYFSGYTLSRPFQFPSGLSNTPDPGFFANLPRGTPVAILSTVVDDTVPPIATHSLFWAQRTNNLWVLPAILRNEDSNHPPQHIIPAPRLAELDRLQHQWMVEDLNRWHPALILVLRCEDPTVQCQILEDRHDNLLAWFQRDPAFRAAFAPYRYLRSSGPYDAYTRP